MTFGQLELLQFLEFKETLNGSDRASVDFFTSDPEGFQMPLSLSVAAFISANPKTIENVLIALNSTYRRQVGLS